jgi:prevent-host-death family protein
MQRLRPTEDIKPLSEFRAHAASLMEQIRTTKRPLVLTQRGHSTAVVLDVSEYERLVEEVETLRDIRLAESQLERGDGIPHDEAQRQVLAALK